MFMTIKTDFIPSEDTGQINVNTEAADRTSFDQMAKYQKQLQDIAMRDPNIEDVMSTVGGGGARSGTNTGNMLFKLKPRGERDLSADQIIQEIRPKLARVMGVNAFMQNPPVIRVGGGSSKSLYQYVLQSTNMDELQQNAAKLTKYLQGVPGLADVTNDMDFNSPSVEVKIDRDQAAIHGVSISIHRDRAGRRLRRRADLGDLCQRRRILGDAGAARRNTSTTSTIWAMLYISSSGVNGSSGSGGIVPNATAHHRLDRHRHHQSGGAAQRRDHA